MPSDATRPAGLSIAGLMTSVLCIAVGIAALKNASASWAGAMLLSTLGNLTVAVPGIVYRDEGRRAWWLGFAVFGWGFAALTLAPWSRPENLPTADLLNYAYARVSPPNVVAMDPFTVSGMVDAGTIVVLDDDPPLDGLAAPPLGSHAVVAIGSTDLVAFRGIGHCLLTLIVACVGGLLARWFHGGRGPRGRE